MMTPTWSVPKVQALSAPFILSGQNGQQRGQERKPQVPTGMGSFSSLSSSVGLPWQQQGSCRLPHTESSPMQSGDKS